MTYKFQKYFDISDNLFIANKLAFSKEKIDDIEKVDY